MRRAPTSPGVIRCQSGQSSLEWTGLVCLIALVAAVAGGAASGLSADAGLRLAHAVHRKLLCAVSLFPGCGRAGSLDAAYGPRLASLVRQNVPELRYGRGMLGLPVDYRTCRSPYCADGTQTGRQLESTAGERVTLFTRVLERGGGSTYLQYWAYYPESDSMRGVPLAGDAGYHAHDWESFNVRIGPDGAVSERASSHSGYSHGRSIANLASDAGGARGSLPWLVTELLERAGLREAGGWGPRTGTYLIRGGSHAGNVAEYRADPDATGLGRLDRMLGRTRLRAAAYPSWSRPGEVRLIPLEQVKDDPDSRAAGFGGISPPWEKEAWRDPEARGTG